MDQRRPAPSRPGGPEQWLRWGMPESYPFTVAGPCRNFAGFPILPDVSLARDRGTARYFVSAEKLTRSKPMVKGQQSVVSLKRTGASVQAPGQLSLLLDCRSATRPSAVEEPE